MPHPSEPRARAQDGLEAEIAELRAMLKECADELEAEIEAHYKGLLVYPVMQRKRARDLQIIDRARKLLGEAK